MAGIDEVKEESINAMKSVADVKNIDIPACLIATPNRSTLGSFEAVLSSAATIMYISSTPRPRASRGTKALNGVKM